VQFYYLCLRCSTRRSIWSGGSSIRASAWWSACALQRPAHARDRFPTYRYKLTCFVIAGTLCGLAGRCSPITPLHQPGDMYWTRSGTSSSWWCWRHGLDLRALVGAVALLVLEEVLSGITNIGRSSWAVAAAGRAVRARGIDGLLQAIGRERPA